MVGSGFGLVDSDRGGKRGMRGRRRKELVLLCIVLHIHTFVYLSVLIWDYLVRAGRQQERDVPPLRYFPGVPHLAISSSAALSRRVCPSSRSAPPFPLMKVHSGSRGVSVVC